MIDLFRRSARLLGLLIALTALIGAVSTGPGLASAGQTSVQDTHAGIIIYFDEETIEYHLIELPDEDLNAFDLLMETGLDLEVQPFSGLGEAVCAIDETGCPGSDCFCESYSSPAYYWRFLLRDGDQWVPQHQGASQHTVEAGEIHAWAWTADAPELPDVSFSDLSDLAENGTEPTSTPEVDDASPPSGQTDDQQPEARSDESEGASGGVDSTRCLQFIGLLGLLTGAVVWAGARRYRVEESS